MTYMSINGISLPVREGEGERMDDSVSFGQRSVTGTFIRHTVARKARWRITAPLLTAAEATALEGLLSGDGTVWSFDTDLYADGTGTLLTASPNALLATSAPTPRFGARRLTVITSPITYWSETLDTWTVGVWWHDGGDWVHRLQTSNGTQWEDGVSGTYAWDLSPTGGDFQLGVGAWDDLVLLRFALTDAQGGQWPQTSAFSALPQLTLSGDCTRGRAVTVVSELGAFGDRHTHAGGQTSYVVSAELREV